MNTKRCTINCAPNELLVESKPAMAAEWLSDETQGDTIDTIRKLYQQEAQAPRAYAQAEARKSYNKKHRLMNFDVGDGVFLRLNEGYQLPGKPPRKWR